MAVWARFQTKDGNTSFGTVANGQITEFSGDMFSNPTATGKTFAEADVKLLAPTQPTKILALWNNFKALGAKLGVLEHVAMPDADALPFEGAEALGVRLEEAHPVLGRVQCWCHGDLLDALEAVPGGRGPGGNLGGWMDKG